MFNTMIMTRSQMITVLKCVILGVGVYRLVSEISVGDRLDAIVSNRE